ncbi:hypothetical protein TraAM80_04910 [Trypanosoma rangeli]|uniref:Uncharacterized protein n=1 Tax=Trypanosoma rangeli TaxID=5698 RepID=A0A422NH57_TRYRA|nr:uncharacterized protein TraAM80_04910 [Trypanosoma rangeli]RNF04784.1 hypothetical protein TraAM80_04910 [Trypanosoma rangeli]|eukprot:RNF04784.1 hypothetical protein TraAM80_04910 [Trypanosoma rangeli]
MRGSSVVSLLCPVDDGYTWTGGVFFSACTVFASVADMCGSWDKMVYWRDPVTDSPLSPVGRLCRNDVPHCGQHASWNVMWFAHRFCSRRFAASLVEEYANNKERDCVVRHGGGECFTLVLRHGHLPHMPSQEEVSCGMRSAPLAMLGRTDNLLEEVPVVLVHRQPGGTWAIELPLSHGIFFCTFRIPNPVVLSTFYR